jgi:L-fucose isomerase-like protein
VAYLLASRLHDAKYVSEAGELVRASAGGLKSPESPEGEAYPLIVHATGGTTQAALELVQRCGARGAVLVGVGEHNGLASALHARAELEAMGLPAAVYQCPSLAECRDVVARAARVARAASSLVRVRAALVGVDARQARRAGERLGWSVEFVPLQRLESAISAAEPDDDALRSLGDERAARVAAALKRVAGGAELVALQCFPLLERLGFTPCLALAALNARGIAVACEGDLAAGLAMLLSRRLAGLSGWIANVVYRRGGEVLLAHCTASLDLLKSWRVTAHFESGLPHAIAGELKPGVYTLVSVSPHFDRAAVGRAALEKSGAMVERACRTQALVRLERDVELERAAPANHHVLIPGDVALEAGDVLRLLSLAVVYY